jgi:murein DD-endopeptidase MepM/ murein hydrolase activator NlpD
MNVILFLHRGDKAWRINLAQPLAIAAVCAGALLTIGAIFSLGLAMGGSSKAAGIGNSPLEWTRTFSRQQAEIAELRQQLQQRVDALAARVGQVNAHVIRLDALGKRLTTMANIDSREFNFDTLPPSGGDASEPSQRTEAPDLMQLINDVEDKLLLRDSQMTALENVILSRQLREQIQPDGRPVKQGFISSYYGARNDPINGSFAFHRGIDFAGNTGDAVVSVAAGVVSFAGVRSGYGNTIEVSHGNGYVTRYAHNHRNLVAVGTMVKRGETLAAMGSTGHSTGPHVHFEVLRNGAAIDPLSYIGR